MSKKKKADKGAGKTAAARIKLPKEVAGMKVPKALRRQGETLIEQVQGPAGRELIAAGLAVAAAAIASRSKPGQAALAEGEQAAAVGKDELRELFGKMANTAAAAFRAEFTRKG